MCKCCSGNAALKLSSSSKNRHPLGISPIPGINKYVKEYLKRHGLTTIILKIQTNSANSFHFYFLILLNTRKLLWGE